MEAAPPIFKEMTARRLFGDEFYPSLTSESSSSSPHHLKYHKGLSRQGLRIGDDGFVDWRYNEPRLPYNWSSSKKAYTSIIICFFEFWMMASSSAGTFASLHARRQLGVSQTSGFFVFMTMYLFGQAIGSVIFSPLSENYGRRNLYIASISTYCVFSVFVAAVPSAIAAGLGRFVTGVAAAIPATLAFGLFEDMHSRGVRIWMLFIYTLAGNSGLVLGPIYSAYVSAYFGWRWVFYISAMVSGLGIIAAVFMKETHIDFMLEGKVKDLVVNTGDNSFRTPERTRPTLQTVTTTGFVRPLQFLVTEPIVICCAVLMILTFSYIYGLTEGLIIVYTEFGFTESTTTSLAFLPLLMGLVLNVLPRLYEQHVSEQQVDLKNNKIQSHLKLRSLMISCPCLVFGLWLFAWTIPPQILVIPWEFSMIGLVFIGYATNDFAYVLFGYLADTYGQHGASACSALNLSRFIMAAVFPLFTWSIYLQLGSNIATTIFAAAATVFCATPFLLVRFGDQIQQRSRYLNPDWHSRRLPPKEKPDPRHDSFSTEIDIE